MAAALLPLPSVPARTAEVDPQCAPKGAQATAATCPLDMSPKLSTINAAIKSLTTQQLRAHLTALGLCTQGCRDVLHARLRNWVKIAKLGKSWSNAHYDFVCVIDFEATCDDGARSTFPHEIIEFPVVLLNAKTLQIEAEFSSFCRPVLRPALTPFCTTLTGICQADVDSAPLFEDVLRYVDKWMAENRLGAEGRAFVVATDGPWDLRDFMTIQCALARVQRPAYACAWIDVRRNFESFYGRRCKLEQMLTMLNLRFEGRQHSGIDDSRNIARILAQMLSDDLGELKVETITDALGRLSADERGGLEIKCKTSS